MGRCIGSLYCSLATSAALRRDIENRPSVPRAVVGCTLREFAVPCVGERASTVHHWRNAAVCTASASHRELAQQKLHGWGSRAHFVLVRHIFVSCSTSMKVAWKMKWSSTSLVLARIRERADDAVGWAERRSWAVFGRARSTSKPSPGLKKRLHTDAARWLLPGHRPERSAWLGRYIRDLLTAARCAELPPAARETG